MASITREILAKSILSRSGISGINYCINPYVGCGHGCVYCYATFMKKYTGHTEPWGSFVDAKINSPVLLRKALTRAAPGTIIMSSVTDAYQPIEKKYGITRACLEVLVDTPFHCDILTKSPLVLRDMDLLKGHRNLEVGLTITTDNEAMRRLFEPNAPPLAGRLGALKTLHENGISTYVFVGPLLPMNPDVLAKMVFPYVDRVLIDRMNYVSKTALLYRKAGLQKWLDPEFVGDIIERLKENLAGKSIDLC